MRRKNKTEIRKGETVNLSINWLRVEKDISTTVSSVAWSSDNTNISLGTPTLSASIATVPVTNANTENGCSTLTCTATMADSQVIVRKIMIDLIDETCSASISNDYGRYR